ncbi:hypothetical protein BDY19DRAFT_890129 [Irpex rosettiformis]|uniref:Uncharacterized protein n=1 Tax=Irpex rosettiformis TaxID=378272 RepID=A0ACB8U4M9_9APHY|nr:hypothetical protein BDY19DRAFT_890129 [Irpex rosettiformis]
MISSPTFLFEPVEGKQPRTARKIHIRRLYDVLELCLHQGDMKRAMRAWTILVRCKEMDWKTMWRTGALMAGTHSPYEGSQAQDRLEYLSAMMRQYAEAREAIFQEFVLLLIKAGQHERALDELELYLPSPPYQDNPVLHLYAGLLCLYLAQPNPENPEHLNRRTLRDAEQYLQRTRQLDPDNTIAIAWLENVRYTLRLSPQFAIC